MKNTKLFVKAFCIFAVLMLTFLPISVFAAEAPHEHVDVNGDLLCDISECDEKLPCPHKDINGDQKCDIEGCGVCLHIDEDKKDGRCDIEGCGACLIHKDKNRNGVCDNDGCTAAVESASIKSNVIRSLQIFAVGMVGIFVVVGIIILSIYALTTVIEKKNDGN